MIVLDAHLDDAAIRAALRWAGPVSGIDEIAPSGCADELIPRYLLAHRHCTFLTINTQDFWRQVEPHPRFSIVCLTLDRDDPAAVAERVRRLFRHADFDTQRKRSGKVVRVGPDRVSYYSRLADVPTVVELP